MIRNSATTQDKLSSVIHSAQSNISEEIPVEDDIIEFRVSLSSKRDVLSFKIGGARQKTLLILIISIQSFFNLTETHTQRETIEQDFSLDTYRPELGHPRIKQIGNHQLRISPTKIKFSTRSDISGNKIAHVERSARGPDRIEGSPIDFSNVKSNRRPQMAPAYELWLNSNFSRQNPVLMKRNQMTPRIIGVDRSFSSKLRIKDRITDGMQKSLDPMINSEADRRGALPGKMTYRRDLSAASEGISRSVGTKIDTNSNNQVDNSEDLDEVASKDESESDQQDDPTATSDMNENQAANDSADEDEFEQENKSAGGGINQGAAFADRVNLNTAVRLDPSGMVRAESRKLTESPVYPPGDLERLYSDALLVYVKDFNQYIKK